MPNCRATLSSLISAAAACAAESRMEFEASPAKEMRFMCSSWMSSPGAGGPMGRGDIMGEIVVPVADRGLV